MLNLGDKERIPFCSLKELIKKCGGPVIMHLEALGRPFLFRGQIITRPVLIYTKC